jgi:hypothetical protein
MGTRNVHCQIVNTQGAELGYNQESGVGTARKQLAGQWGQQGENGEEMKDTYVKKGRIQRCV